MANSSSEFNVPEFKEYNPTPYAGGYDISRTYGKPLSPSDTICYPRSSSHPSSSFPDELANGSVSHPNSPFPDELANGSVTLPSGTDVVDQTTKPPNGIEPPKPYDDEEEEKPWYHSGGNWFNGPNSDYWGNDIFSNWYGAPCGNCHDNDYGKPIDSYQGDYNPWCGYRGEEGGYDYGKPVAQPLEDMGPCASLFGGYFPCLSRNYEKRDGVEQGNGNHWKGTAEYFFGHSYPYGERSDENISYGVPSYGYERHYPEQPLHVQSEYNEESWFQQPSYNEAYQEQVYPHSEYGTGSYNENGEYFYYNQQKYPDYDE